MGTRDILSGNFLEFFFLFLCQRRNRPNQWRFRERNLIPSALRKVEDIQNAHPVTYRTGEWSIVYTRVSSLKGRYIAVVFCGLNDAMSVNRPKRPNSGPSGLNLCGYQSTWRRHDWIVSKVPCWTVVSRFWYCGRNYCFDGKSSQYKRRRLLRLEKPLILLLLSWGKEWRWWMIFLNQSGNRSYDPVMSSKMFCTSVNFEIIQKKGLANRMWRTNWLFALTNGHLVKSIFSHCSSRFCTSPFSFGKPQTHAKSSTMTMEKILTCWRWQKSSINPRRIEARADIVGGDTVQWI